MRRAVIRRTVARMVSYPLRATLGAITHVRTGHFVAALTFDDGPHPVYTPRLLEILDRFGTQGTFFMVGEMASRHPELVRRVAEAGHAIGNHSWDHPAFPLIAAQERRRQIELCRRALGPYGLKLFRPPYGYYSPVSHLDVVRLRHTVIAWSLHAEDWIDRSAEWMALRLIQRIRPGGIVVLHDALFDTIEPQYENRGPMIDALGLFLSQVANRYRFVTIPVLLRHGVPQRELWSHQPSVALLNSLGSEGRRPRRYAVHP